MNDWVQLTVSVPVDRSDVVAGDLWAAGIGVGGIEERPGDTPTSVILVAGFDAGVLGAVLDALAGHDLEPAVERVAADEGLDGWRDFAVPHLVGRVALVPAWWDGPLDDADPAVGERVEIRLDAGRSFGHGGHVTTRLALDALQDLDLAGAGVLDVGTGSGVLAIAAAKLGAARVVAVDVAADAVDAARSNVTRNELTATVGVRLGSVEAAADVRVVEVVVANIEAPVLEALAPQVVRLLRPGDRVVLSGFLATQTDRVLAAYDDLQVQRRLDEGEWSALVLVNR